MNLSKQLRDLSNAEKILLVEKIWNSIDKEAVILSEDHEKELDRRIDLDVQDETNYHSWIDVKKNLGKK